MGKKDPDSCLPTGKGRDDREVQSKSRFDPLRLEIKYPGTAILLLRCQENPVLVAAAAALSKFGSKGGENLEILLDLEILDAIIPLIEHEDIFTRRFATKLLAEMAAVTSVRNFLLESETYIPNFVKVLTNDTDLFIHEFTSLFLAELSKDMFGVAQLLKQCGDFDFLFERLLSPDPDVKKNTIEIMTNLLRDPTAAQEIFASKNFNFPVIFELFKQPYPVTQQLALTAVDLLVSRNKDENIQELFRRSGGLNALLNIIESEEMIDLHSQVLGILQDACDNPRTVELLNTSGGIRKLFTYLETSTNLKCILYVLNVIVRLANTTIGRKSLYTYGIVDYLLSTLRETTPPDILGVSCYGIAKMTQYGPAALALTQENPTREILGFIKNENLDWSVRHAATFCMKELLGVDDRNCENLLDIKGQYYLLWLIRQPTGKIPMETQIAATQGLMAIAGYPTFRTQLIDQDLIDAVCAPFESKSSNIAELKIACCNALSTFCIEKTAREIFLTVNGPRKLCNLLLDSESVPTRDAAAQLIQQLCFDSALAPSFIQIGCLDYMLKNRSASRIVPSWDSCIEAIFNSYLPAKFAITGHLSLHDVTKDGFYVMRTNVKPFPVLEELFALKICPMQTIYVCNFARPQVDSLTDEAGATKPNEKRRSVDKTGARSKYMDAGRIDERADETFGTLQTDPYLCEYLELFNCKLYAAEPKEVAEASQPGLVNIRYIESRVKMLGEFVARQMSGPDPVSRCIDHQLELHIDEIKMDLQTNVIPLGQIRVGMYLERALLFKVIADRILLPAALVRGEYGITWIEIALPEMEMQIEGDTMPGLGGPMGVDSMRTMSSRQTKSSVSSNRPSLEPQILKLPTAHDPCQTVYPTKLLRPNYIVDLVHSPGRLIPMNTVEADMYCCKPISYCEIRLN